MEIRPVNTEEKIKHKLKLSEQVAAFNADRTVTIDSRIRDVIQDYKILGKEKNSDKAGKCGRNESLPPNSSYFHQHKLIRYPAIDREGYKVLAVFDFAYSHILKDLTELGETLKEENDNCDRNDVIRQQRLEEVAKKTNDLARRFLAVEAAYSGVLKEREDHNEMMEAFSKEVQNYGKTSRRYGLCGEALSEVAEIMQKAINENKCFEDFIRSLAGQNVSSSAASHEVAAFIAEFETIESAEKTISDQIDEALAKGKKAELAVLQAKNKFMRELQNNIEILITSHRAVELSDVMNVRYEKALAEMSADTVSAATTLTKVLHSAENMVEKLISSKAVDHSYRKKTLAQQFEAIRQDYIKKKAILHEYHKSKAGKDKHKAALLKAVDKKEELQEQRRHQKQRLADLEKKRVILAWMDRRDQEEKRLKREVGYVPSGFVVRESPEKYDPLEDQAALMNLEDEGRVEHHAVRWRATDLDDYAEDSSEADEDDIAAYCSPSDDNLLGLASEERFSFMMAVESEESGNRTKTQAKDKRKSRASVYTSATQAKDKRKSRASVYTTATIESDLIDVDVSRDRRVSSLWTDTLNDYLTNL